MEKKDYELMVMGASRNHIYLLIDLFALLCKQTVNKILMLFCLLGI